MKLIRPILTFDWVLAQRLKLQTCLNTCLLIFLKQKSGSLGWPQSCHSPASASESARTIGIKYHAPAHHFFRIGKTGLELSRISHYNLEFAIILPQPASRVGTTGVSHHVGFKIYQIAHKYVAQDRFVVRSPNLSFWVNWCYSWLLSRRTPIFGQYWISC